jgi:endonuclease G
MFAERYTRQCALAEESLFVVSGPIITNDNPAVIGENKVTVPDGYYKVLYDETPPEKMMAFVMPNGKPDYDIWKYATNVVYVEDITGLSFFPYAETNKINWLKAEYIKDAWPEFDNPCVKINPGKILCPIQHLNKE